MWRILCNSDHRDDSNNQITILAVMVVKKSGGLDLCFQANSCMWGVCKDAQSLSMLLCAWHSMLIAADTTQTETQEKCKRVCQHQGGCMEGI